MSEPAPHAQPDEDLELALRLHRELNAVPRRQRQPARNQAASAALKTLAKKLQHQESDSSSSGSEASGVSEPKKRRSGSGSGVPSDNDSGSKRKRQREGPPTRRPARPRPPRRPQHAAAADEARAKAAAAAERGEESGATRTHVKCFYAGLQHGAWLAVEALTSRASLAAAVSHAFRDDGVACSSEAATVVFVAPDKQSLEFAGGRPQGGDLGTAAALQQNGSNGSGGGDEAKWEAAARSAVRVYVR